MALKLETGGYLRLEDGGRLLLEGEEPQPPAGGYASARARPRVAKAPERIRVATARERPRVGDATCTTR